MNMLNSAKKYKSVGFSIIPLLAKSKKPAIDSWLPYQERIATDNELEEWFGNGSTWNIGIVTGEISGIDVVDLDSQEAIQYAKDHQFPKTPTAKTNKGFHNYYEHKKGVRNFQKRDDLPGIDLRGDGGYVVAPPSRHPSGSQYQWVEGKGLHDIPLGELPETVLISVPQEKTPLKELYKGAQQGSRNDSLARLVGSWVSDGLLFNECMDNAQLWNSKNNPPLSEVEIREVIKSIMKKHEQENPKANYAEAWQDIIPFDDYSVLPAFPSHVLPEIGREIVETVASVNQVDSGLAGSIYLGALSTCIGGKVEVDLRTHKEPLNIYLCPVLDSGERKSSTMKCMTAPIYTYQEEKRKELSVSVSEEISAQKIREARLETLQKQAAKCEEGVERDEIKRKADRVVREIEENPVTTLPTFLVDNVTTEALGDLMAVNNECMSMVSAEADIFSVMAGRYNEKSANIDIYLKAHAGDNWSNHRIGRKSKSMESPCLTMCLTAQRQIISEIGRNKQFKGRGLLARFLYSLSESKIGYRPRQTKTISTETVTAYKEHLYRLMSIPFEKHILSLSPEATEAWNEFYNDIEKDMRPGKPMEAIKDWGSKLSGAVARIAGLLHYAEHGRDAYRLQICVGIVGASCAIGAYFREHALAVFGLMGEDPQTQAAKNILNYLNLHKPSNFKGRDVLRNKNVFNSMDEITPGLKLLVERHYIRPIETESIPGRGRPESITYELNPKLKH